MEAPRPDFKYALCPGVEGLTIGTKHQPIAERLKTLKLWFVPSI
ncbi:MAG: hypothetical protein ACI9BW_004652 [Gammaproteobacteria bacterium]|jgi:hypothetical protein